MYVQHLNEWSTPGSGGVTFPGSGSGNVTLARRAVPIVVCRLKEATEYDSITFLNENSILKRKRKKRETRKLINFSQYLGTT